MFTKFRRPGRERDHHISMKKTLTVAFSLLLMAGVASAQRGNLAAPGHTAKSSVAVKGRGRGFRPGVVGPYGYGYGGYVPIWGYDYTTDLPYWDYINFPPTDNGAGPYDQGANSSYEQQGNRAPASSYAAVTAATNQPAVASPKLIEVPDSMPESKQRPQPLAVFVLNDGGRLESSRYVLTADSAHLEIGRQQCTIPLSALNIDATVAANQQRGIPLTFPTSSDSLFVSF